MKTAMFLLLSVPLAAAAWASEPGQPIGSEDFHLSLPGLSAETFIPRNGCQEPGGPGPAAWCPYSGGQQPVFDAEGYQYVWHWEAFSLPCEANAQRHYITRLSRTAIEEPVAMCESRCITPVPGGGVDMCGIDSPRVDLNSGELYFRFSTWCGGGSDPERNCAGYNTTGGMNFKNGVVRLKGLTSEFDVLQSFSPQASQLGFRVPYMPEGMPAADHFDTYWGDLSTVGNWSQAHGLQCHYPAASPARGDYLTAADTLPTPQPGHGYYYVTAATYQGQTRYGRKSGGGRVTGRDPALLPACTTEAQR